MFRTNLLSLIHCISQFGTIGTMVQATRSSSGALPSILHYTHSTIGTVVQASRLHHCTDCTVCVMQYTRHRSWWWTSNSFETCRARKNGGIKIIYKNRASRWSSTQVHKCFLSENLLERDHVEDPGEDGRILKWISKKWGQNVDLIQVAQQRVNRWAVLNAVMNLTLRGIL